MIQPLRATMVLQPDHEAEPNTRAELRIYHGDELIATTMRTIHAYPPCLYCGEDIPPMVESPATPDGVHHPTCTPRRRKK